MATTKARKAAQQNNVVPLLERVTDYKTRKRFVLIEVLRNYCGRELAAQKRAEGKTFNWKRFNEVFRQQCEGCSYKQLRAYAAEKFGLQTEQDILNAKQRFDRQRRSRQQKKQEQEANDFDMINHVEDLELEENVDPEGLEEEFEEELDEFEV